MATAAMEASTPAVPAVTGVVQESVVALVSTRDHCQSVYLPWEAHLESALKGLEEVLVADDQEAPVVLVTPHVEASEDPQEVQLATETMMMKMTTPIRALLPVRAQAPGVRRETRLEGLQHSGDLTPDHQETQLAATMEAFPEPVEEEQEDQCELVEAALDLEQPPVEALVEVQELLALLEGLVGEA